MGEETNTHLATPSFQVVVESDKASPQSPFLRSKQPQFPQSLLMGLVLDSSPASLPFSGHAPATQRLSCSEGPKTDLLKVQPHQCQVQGHDHCPTPAGHTVLDTSQDAIGLLDHLGTLLAHVQLTVDLHPQVLILRAAFQTLFHRPVALHGVAVTQTQDLALGLVEPHTLDPICPDPSIESSYPQADQHSHST